LHRAPERGPRTLFATHYQELTQLEKHLPRLRNFSVAVKEWNDEIVFVRRVIPGAADRSYPRHANRVTSKLTLPTNHRHPLQPSTRVHSASLDAQRIRSGTLEKEVMKTRKLTFERVTLEQMPATFDGLIKLHAPRPIHD
jgi:hypothetical protein